MPRPKGLERKAAEKGRLKAMQQLNEGKRKRVAKETSLPAAGPSTDPLAQTQPPSDDKPARTTRRTTAAKKDNAADKLNDKGKGRAAEPSDVVPLPSRGVKRKRSSEGPVGTAKKPQIYANNNVPSSSYFLNSRMNKIEKQLKELSARECPCMKNAREYEEMRQKIKNTHEKLHAFFNELAPDSLQELMKTLNDILGQDEGGPVSGKGKEVASGQSNQSSEWLEVYTESIQEQLKQFGQSSRDSLSPDRDYPGSVSAPRASYRYSAAENEDPELNFRAPERIVTYRYYSGGDGDEGESAGALAQARGDDSDGHHQEGSPATPDDRSAGPSPNLGATRSRAWMKTVLREDEDNLPRRGIHSDGAGNGADNAGGRVDWSNHPRVFFRPTESD